MEHHGRREARHQGESPRHQGESPLNHGEHPRHHEEELTLRGSLRPPGPVQFAITRTTDPGLVRLEIKGELDVLTTPRLATELDSLVRQSKDDIVVDLRRTGFIDSAGLQILLGTQRRLGRFSRRMTVVCDDGPVRRVIEMTRLEEAFGLTRGHPEPGPN